LSFVQTGGVEVEELFGDVPSPVVGDTGTWLVLSRRYQMIFYLVLNGLFQKTSIWHSKPSTNRKQTLFQNSGMSTIKCNKWLILE
jgi:hypothetical protein